MEERVVAAAVQSAAAGGVGAGPGFEGVWGCGGELLVGGEGEGADAAGGGGVGEFVGGCGGEGAAEEERGFGKELEGCDGG